MKTTVVWIILAKIKINEILISKRTVSNNTRDIAMKTILTLAFSDYFQRLC